MPDAIPLSATGLPAKPGSGGGAGYGGYSGFTQYPMGGERHLADYLRVLYRRRWVAATAFVVVVVSAMLYTFTRVPEYDAVVKILIENENPNVVKFEEVLQQNKDSDDYYQTQYRILQSRVLARRTLDAEKLWEHPAFASKAKPQSPGGFHPVRWIIAGTKSVGALLQPAKPPSTPDASETAAQSLVIDAFLDNLNVRPVRNSRLVDVAYRSTDPRLAMQVANVLANQYIEQNLEFKFLATQQATQFLSQRMAEQRQALEQNEIALQKYREETDSVSLEDRQNIVVQRLADLNAAVTKARTDRIQKESVWNQIRAIQSDRAALDTHPLVLTNTFIQQLKGEVGELQRHQAQLAERLGEKHPEMVKNRSALTNAEAKLQGEIAKVVQSIRNDYQAAVEQERSLTAALNQQKDEALALNRQSIRYGQLQRDAASSRQLFEGLLQRSKETGIEGELRTSNIRVVDKAELPRAPSTPRTMNNIVLGLVSGLLLGVGLAFFFEYLDNRIKTPEEIKSHLGIPFLGLVPALRNAEVPGSPLVSNGVTRQFGEAFRTIRTNVLFSSAQEGCRSVVVTSTVPGEGKSVVASNLALSLAMAGQRALLIDGDMRRPKVHTLFDLSQEPGLSNVIVGSAQASETLKRTTLPNLWIMVAGKQPPNPAELLGSRRFTDLMAALTPHFDWIIIDSPPVMAVTDASIVSHLVHGVVFVVGCEMTGRTAAKTALDQLDAAKAKYLGAVLNRVDLRRHSYYYSHYYKRAYSEYYAAPEVPA